LRWAGGKRRLVPLIVELVSEVFDEADGIFHDPFVGGGSIPFGLIDLGGFKPNRIRISDINPTLVEAYKAVQSKNPLFFEELSEIQRLFDSELGDTVYADLRSQFNAHRSEIDARQAARFVALNATSFNGLWRENSLGEYNVPYGRPRNPLVLDVQGLEECARKLAGVQITNLDYRTYLSKVKPNDFVFLDPPYLPISDSSSFSAYHGAGFGLSEHIDLSNEILRLTVQGVEVILCNSFCKASIDVYQHCGLNLYKHFVGRSIAADGKRRENGAAGKALGANPLIGKPALAAELSSSCGLSDWTVPEKRNSEPEQAQPKQVALAFNQQFGGVS
jgi:DNA adenine methylase